MLTPVQLFKALSDETRLRCLALIGQGERCVCDLTGALQLSQPKVSRHLAQFRANGILLDRRQGQWVYYRINPELPQWALSILRETLTACGAEPGLPRVESSCC
jgi:ArsR family transcriptional regulator, arsenate/arsenite/antimonite-responsive transcriptional repressor